MHWHFMYDIKLKRTQFSIEEPLEEKKSTRRQFEVNLHFESEQVDRRKDYSAESKLQTVGITANIGLK